VEQPGRRRGEEDKVKEMNEWEEACSSKENIQVYSAIKNAFS